MGGITNGEQQELMGVGVDAGILVVEGRGEAPIQVSNTDTKHVAVFRYVAASSLDFFNAGFRAEE